MISCTSRDGVASTIIGNSVSACVPVYDTGWSAVYSLDARYCMAVHIEAISVVVYVVIMTSVIVVIYSWETKIEMGAYIVVVNAKSPTTTIDVSRTKEIGSV